MMNTKVKRQIKKTLLICGLGLLNFIPTYAQVSDSIRFKRLEDKVSKLENLNGLRISGYIQGQFQYGQENASLKVGAPNTDVTEDFNRMGIRRGRLKFTYEKRIATSVFQIDMTEKGLGIKDVYLQVKDSEWSASLLKIGVFNRPFGYEIERSSSSRESPERAAIITTLFPEERDLGAMMTLQAKKSSPWHFLKLDAGLFAGNGIKSDIKNKKDLIGHLSAYKTFNERFQLSGGISYYRGTVYQGSENRYTFSGNAFILNSNPANIGTFAKREYFGVDAQISVTSNLGLTSFSAEFITGSQPSEKGGSKSPNSSTTGNSDIHIRDFNGGHYSFAQDFGKIPLSMVLKYDWYDPNTKISKNDIGLNETGKGEISYQTIGFGLLWKINNTLKMTAYYDWAKNETSGNLTGYEKDIKDDVFTLRLQYKF